MPEISRFYGIIITMYLPDHNPPHFHVKYNEYRATIDIKSGKIIGEMPRRALNFGWIYIKTNLWKIGAEWKTAKR